MSIKKRIHKKKIKKGIYKEKYGGATIEPSKIIEINKQIEQYELNKDELKQKIRTEFDSLKENALILKEYGLTLTSKENITENGKKLTETLVQLDAKKEEIEKLIDIKIKEIEEFKTTNNLNNSDKKSSMLLEQLNTIIKWLDHYKLYMQTKYDNQQTRDEVKETTEIKEIKFDKKYILNPLKLGIYKGRLVVLEDYPKNYKLYPDIRKGTIIKKITEEDGNVIDVEKFIKEVEQTQEYKDSIPSSLTDSEREQIEQYKNPEEKELKEDSWSKWRKEGRKILEEDRKAKEEAERVKKDEKEAKTQKEEEEEIAKTQQKEEEKKLAKAKKEQWREEGKTKLEEYKETKKNEKEAEERTKEAEEITKQNQKEAEERTKQQIWREEALKTLKDEKEAKEAAKRAKEEAKKAKETAESLAKAEKEAKAEREKRAKTEKESKESEEKARLAKSAKSEKEQWREEGRQKLRRAEEIKKKTKDS